MAKGAKTGGRTKGTPNKTTAAVKNALTEAFEKLGGVRSLAEWGQANPTEFYKLWVKLLPQEVALTDPDGDPVSFTLNIGGNAKGD
ncbi:MAG: hypothetical protein K8U57_37165 [Planctomycetes bacterium]|nr:hypothetical protein [Planctomycetota bacterium]